MLLGRLCVSRAAVEKHTTAPQHRVASPDACAIRIDRTGHARIVDARAAVVVIDPDAGLQKAERRVNLQIK